MNENLDFLNDQNFVNTLYNNSTINIDSCLDKKTLIKINCPKLGSGDVHHNTNSPFCKHSSCVNYNWQNITGVNWLSIHRLQPVIAYVINPTYRKSLLTKSSMFSQSEQIIRLLNYEENILGKCIGNFTQTIADLCFCYNCFYQEEILLAAVDLNSNINIFNYNELYENGKKSFDCRLILQIKSDSDFIYDSVVLNWCPFVGFEDGDDIDEEDDPGMNLVVASNNTIEFFSVKKLISCNSDFKKSELDVEDHDYQFLLNQRTDSIVKISLSSESSAVCTASKDNKIRFYHIKSQFKELHKWEPVLSSVSNLSYFHFLDDYNQLLENKKHEFWGFAFLGSENGEISIWDLRKWQIIQHLKLVSDSNDEEIFRYKADITSHFIIAKNKNDTFLIQLEFNQEFNNLENFSPKIIKISRFQIYYNIHSFVCKKNNDKKIDLFYISPNSLQRCTINLEQLIEEKFIDEKLLDNSKNISLNNLSKLNESFIDNLLIKNTSKSSENFIKEDILNLDVSSKSINSYKKLEIDNPNTSTSQEVENLFNIKNNKEEIDLNNILPPQLDKTENFHLFKNKFISDSLSLDTSNFVKKSDLNTYATKEDIEKLSKKLDTLTNISLELKHNNEKKDLNMQKLDIIEEKLLNEIVLSKFSTTEVTKKIFSQLNNLRCEWKNHDQIKYLGKILDSFLKKLMEQINITISKGLDEFMSQIKTEVFEINEQLKKMKFSFDNHYETCIKKYEKLNKQIICISDKMKEITEHQQQINSDFAHNITNMQVLPSTSSSPMIFNKVFCKTASTLSLVEEEKAQLKKEKIKNIWSLIESNDDEKILEGFSSALDLKDQNLMTKILEKYKDDHMKLIKIIKQDQTVLISLLNQLTIHQLEEQLWKIKFIPDILSLLELKSSLIRNHFNIFINKLIKKLEKIQNSDYLDKSEHEATIRLILFVLDCQKKTISTLN